MEPSEMTEEEFLRLVLLEAAADPIAGQAAMATGRWAEQAMRDKFATKPGWMGGEW